MQRATIVAWIKTVLNLDHEKRQFLNKMLKRPLFKTSRKILVKFTKFLKALKIQIHDFFWDSAGTWLAFWLCCFPTEVYSRTETKTVCCTSHTKATIHEPMSLPHRGRGRGRLLPLNDHTFWFLCHPYCTHVQWKTYCEGAILSLTHSLRR